jgi:hypothetical protein
MEQNNARAALTAVLQAELLGLDNEEQPEDLIGLPGISPPAVGGNAGKGRAHGSHNRRTSELIAYINRRYGSPIEILMQMARAPVVELARELHCSRLDAYKTKQQAAAAATPYLHAKLATIEVVPPGHPGGEPSPLVLAPQHGAIDITDAVVERIDAAGAPELVEGQSPGEALTSDGRGPGDSHRVPLRAIGGNSTTLSLAPQPAVEVVAGSPIETQVADHQVETAVDAALGTLEQLMRGDPQRAARIRLRLAAITG